MDNNEVEFDAVMVVAVSKGCKVIACSVCLLHPPPLVWI